MTNRMVIPGIFVSTIIISMHTLAGEQRTDFDLDDDGLIEINDLGDLDNIRYHPNGTALYGQNLGCPETGCFGFELTTDLDFDTNQDGKLDENDNYWNEGKGWERIGNPLADLAYVFEATFEGNNHTITNLFIDRPDLLEVGLFGWASGARIRNLHLDESLLYVQGAINVGSLVGLAISTQISNCSSKVDIKAKGVAGGLVGRSQLSHIEYSHSASLVEVSSGSSGIRAGGLVGYSYEDSIVASYASGDVSANRYSAGGLLGFGEGETKVIASYATGNVSAPESTGGLIGRAEDMHIEASFSIGFVNGDTLTGGLIGSAENTNVIHSYWATDASGQVYSADGIGLTLAQLECPTEANNIDCSEQTIYPAWDELTNEDGTHYWSFGSRDQLPTLSGNKNDNKSAPKSGSVNGPNLLLLLLLSGLAWPLTKKEIGTKVRLTHK